ncbi:E3 ubiquitin-protein ligase WAV3 [Oryza sativa Japonica Group]|uniref:Uncharacterized protein n=7 Tax=Oryza TaxID=4527 RepID=Q8H922_ORYSJ|nr:E3 ubiquitin-protein ligase WAV3 [Oryza sativa Japonica Group]AAN05523.1 unknown protein [Oryza sativa Japonica Group]KAF2913927.1 hypothetical protein DAI22_10g124700 [Oryza sativa Japonica Group]
MAVAKWERAKRALATRLCVRAPRVRAAAAEAEGEGEEGEGRGRSVAASPPAHVASSRRLSRCGSRSSTKICAICLGGMCSGNGQALFTAECSHKFHFHCISSSVRHGNTVCPICRAVWKELPFQGPLPAAAAADASLLGTARVNPHPLDDRHQHQRMAVVRRLSRGDSVTRQWQLPIFRTLDGGIFDDDEQLDLHPAEDVVGTQDVDSIVADEMAPASVGITTYAAFPAMEESVMVEEFAVLIHLKAPSSPATVTSRAPIDLVTVLDVSWSMAGTKLALLKRAMSFVIQALGPGDRLSVVTFSSSARRLFPLRKMTESGRQRALQRVSSLVADGGTNIADALRKAARVMEDRRERNPVCSIVLLSDGRDTYTVPVPRGGGGGGDQPDYAVLVPSSLLPGGGSARHVQVHAFGFGADHDSPAMHSIAEMSGGTFSFIDAAGSIQDAFAQCIGGLLSVVAQELRLSVECGDDGVLLTSVRSGGYASHVDGDGRGGFVDVGDLYADEERDFLVTVRVPAARGVSALITPSCTYRSTATMETVRVGGDTVTVPRTVDAPVGYDGMSPEVERELHRVQATEDMAAARAAAERGDFELAAAILDERRGVLESRADDDPQSVALAAELREMQDRVETRQRYEESGRAYMLAGLSSHSWQRATARGDSTELTSVIHTYQTPFMVDMLQRSQTLQPEVVVAMSRSAPLPAPSLSLSPPPPPSQLRRRSVRPAMSFPGRRS